MLLLLSQHVVSFEEQRPPLANLNYVRWSDEDRADAGSSRVAHVARGIMEEADVRSFVTALQEFRPDPKKLDSTDGLPAYEFYIRHEAKDLHSAAEVLRLGLEQRVAAFTAERYNCTTCYLCNVLLRRYRASERMAVPSHYDRLAYITAVASLNPTDFDGGLYLQRDPRAESREYFRTGSRDMIFHQYDLNHGVDVIDGSRYSAVFWITDTIHSCQADVAPWYRAPAEAGSADAQDALGELHQLGQHGYARDLGAAVRWSSAAAEQGHAMAQNRLGRLYLSNAEGVPRDQERGMRWVRAAAEQGHSPAEHTMGIACQYGDAAGGAEAAASWFARAAAAGIASSQYELGVAYVNGDGVKMDRRQGIEWLWLAMQQGHAQAKADLRALADAGVFEWTDGQADGEAEGGAAVGAEQRNKDEV